jgi:hypothetical protein
VALIRRRREIGSGSSAVGTKLMKNGQCLMKNSADGVIISGDLARALEISEDDVYELARVTFRLRSRAHRSDGLSESSVDMWLAEPQPRTRSASSMRPESEHKLQNRLQNRPVKIT